MNLSMGWLFSSMLVSTVGMGFFMYGKKQTRFPQLLTGLALMIFPNFMGGPIWILAIGAALLGAMWMALQAGL